MNIQPVKTTPAPDYPDKTRWLAAPLAVGLTAAMALGLSACGERATMGDVVQMPTETCTVQAATTEYIIMGTTPAPESTTVNMGTTALVPEPGEYTTLGMPVAVPELTEVLP